MDTAWFPVGFKCIHFYPQYYPLGLFEAKKSPLVLSRGPAQYLEGHASQILLLLGLQCLERYLNAATQIILLVVVTPDDGSLQHTAQYF